MCAKLSQTYRYDGIANRLRATIDMFVYVPLTANKSETHNKTHETLWSIFFSMPDQIIGIENSVRSQREAPHTTNGGPQSHGPIVKLSRDRDGIIIAVDLHTPADDPAKVYWIRHFLRPGDSMCRVFSTLSIKHENNLIWCHRRWKQRHRHYCRTAPKGPTAVTRIVDQNAIFVRMHEIVSK